jgi:ribosomal protein S18 acetylase RimI-like enzyme
LDLPRLHQLENACFQASGSLPLFALVQYFDLFNATFLVAAENEDCVGFVIAGASSIDPTSAWVLDIAVSPSHRKRGVARELVAKLIAVLRENGVLELQATVSPENTASLALCTGLGFNVEREESAYFGPNERRLLLRMKLLS